MEFFVGKLLGYIVILTRVSAFMVSAPIFNWKTVPVRVKIYIALFTTIFFAMILPGPVLPATGAGVYIIFLLVSEVVYGIAMGLTITFLYSAVKISARIAERQMGMAMAEVMDPFTGERSQPLGMIMEIIFILLLLSANAHHLFLMTVSKSFEAFPPGQIPDISTLTMGIIETGSTMLLIALRLSVPVLAVFTILTVVLGIMARIAPDMNVFFISLPFRVGLGLLIAAYFVPYINSYVKEMSGWMGKLLPI